MSEYETKLSLDNATEHLKTVLDNIRVSNKDLVLLKKEIESKQEEINSLINLGEEIDSNNKTNIKRGIYIEQFYININNKVNSLLTQEKEINKRVSQAEDKLNKINKDASVSLSNYLKTINVQNIVLVGYQNDIISLKQEIKENEETIKKQSRVKTKQENEIVGLNNQIEEAKKDLNNLLNESIVGIEKVSNLIDIEIDKIKNPSESIKLEQGKLNMEKRDLGIIRRRLSTQFKNQNPEKNLPIELQQKDIILPVKPIIN